MQAVQRIFILGLAFVVTLAASLGAVLFYSLLPHISLIGNVTTGVVITGLVCVAALMIAFTFTRICTWLNHRNMFIAGEVVAYLGNNGEFIHLSAQHEAAKIPIPEMRQLAPRVRPSDKDTVIELRKEGLSYRDIEKRAGISFHYVQLWCKEEGLN